MIVPKNKILAIPILEEEGLEKFDMNEISTFLKPLSNNRKRDWFGKDFYKCLPLTIANMQGFSISVPFEFDVMWDGGLEKDSVHFKFYEDEKKFRNKVHIGIDSNFGYGTFTIHLPIMLRTPPGINLMTFSPPNFLTPGLNAMSGVVESDNFRNSFTLTVKINIKNVWIKILKDSPLVGILPVKRYFSEKFEIVSAYDIFEKKVVEEERVIEKENMIVDYYLRHDNHGNIKDRYGKWWCGCYYDGVDIRGNKFKDHQLPGEVKECLDES